LYVQVNGRSDPRIAPSDKIQHFSVAGMGDVYPFVRTSTKMKIADPPDEAADGYI